MRYTLLLLLTLLYLPLRSNTDSLTLGKLDVAVFDAAPFGFLYPDQTYGGLMVELWKTIAEELHYDYEFQLTSMDSLMRGLETGKYDVGIGAISITPFREARVDFSHAINPSGTGICVSRDRVQNPWQNSFFELFISLLRLIGSLFFVLLISGILVWWIEKNHDQSSTSTSIKTFADGLWWAAVTMTTVGYGDKVPNSKAGKVMGIIWIFTSIILLSLFTANASAILNRSVEEIPIQTKEDLRGVTVGAVQKSSGEEYLLREHIEYKRFENINLALDALLKDEIDCVVSNVLVIQYLNKHDKRYFNQLAIASNWLLRNNMGIALPEESSLKEPIDRVLLQLISENKWQQALYEYLGE